jgi:RNA polymerase sigma-70 factor (ECF subfamily)
MSEEIHLPASSPDQFDPLQEAEDAQTTNTGISGKEVVLLEKLRNGDEAVFVSLIQRYHSPMLRLAIIYLPDRFLAEEVVQETWLAVLQGLKKFEGRSSLKTWIFRILLNIVKTRGQREGRSVPFSSLSSFASESSDESEVDPDWFLPPGSPMVPGRGLWVSLPHNWSDIPEERLLSQETRACIHAAINMLAPQQRYVIILRDIAGWTAQEVCDFLSISEGNQRVLLHRARSHVRRALEDYLDGGKQR